MDADGGALFPFCLQHEVCELLGLEESSPSSATPEELMAVCVWCVVCVWGEAGEWGCRKEEFTCLICVCVWCVCVCVAAGGVRQGSGDAGRRNSHALSLGTRRPFLLNQKVCFLTFEMVGVASVRPLGRHCPLCLECEVWRVDPCRGSQL